MYRIGKVSDVKLTERLVRVYFKDVGITSGWLKVIKSAPYIPQKGIKQETEAQEISREVVGTAKEFERHTHEVRISPWLPDVGDYVVCLYNEGFNEDGIVIGGL